jgi:hypothetical protein
MRRGIAALAIATALSVGSLVALADITFVLKSGERISGTGITRSQGTITVSVSGQERKISLNDVAVVIYNDGDPTARELAQLPMADNPPELERHTLFMRDGRVIRGQADDWNPDRLVFDTTAGRQFFNASDIARLFSGRGTTGAAPGERGRRRGEPDATVTVDATTPWTDAGLVVRQGERIVFNTTGTISVLRDANAATGPDGQKDMPRQETFPVRTMSVGGLIGRVGNGRPFPIGSTRMPIDMPASGRLFLGINDDQHGDNGGSFEVKVFRR